MAVVQASCTGSTEALYYPVQSLCTDSTDALYHDKTAYMMMKTVSFHIENDINSFDFCPFLCQKSKVTVTTATSECR